MYDPTEITLEIETDDRTQIVTVPLDFSDFTIEEAERAARLVDGDADVGKATSAFLFVSASRQADLDDESFPVFAQSLSRLFERDTSILKVV